MIKSIRDSIFLCLKICAFDDFLSEAEHEELFRLFFNRDGISRDNFDLIVEEFFEKNVDLESLIIKASPFQDELLIAEVAAKADGLDPRENYALQRCYEVSNLTDNLEHKND